MLHKITMKKNRNIMNPRIMTNNINFLMDQISFWMYNASSQQNFFFSLNYLVYFLLKGKDMLGLHEIMFYSLSKSDIDFKSVLT